METIVITGANRGIGLALSERFIAAGHHVVAGCREPANAEALQRLGVNGNLTVHALDVSHPSSVERFSKQLEGRAVSVLINNAGVMGGDRQGLDNMDYAAWLRTFEVNVLAPFHLTTQLLPNLKMAPRPRVITISSQMGAFGVDVGPGMYIYRSSKSAVSKVMQVMAKELEPDNIIVCPVHPGWVKTDMGGPNAQISAEDSANGLFKLIDGLTMAHSGRFWKWDGTEHVW